MSLRRSFNKLVRKGVAALPQSVRFAIYRSLVDCDPAPSERLELKIAETAAELEACFSLLHDAYVDSGFMKPDPSGMRVTIYHAMPTTTTLCAKWDGEVVGTISLIRESPFGFPMQQIFDLTAVRQAGGSLAEVSALAVHPKFRNTGGTILFPLMKFMYEYCRKFFDTRHLLIAVNPNRIELYESLLGFHRLTANVVDRYDFANGAPAVGAALDLDGALNRLQRMYAGKRPRKNLHHFFAECRLPNIRFPQRRYFTTNDPVLTPLMLDYFFNVRTQRFAELDERKRAMLHAIYDAERYRDALPPVPSPTEIALRRLPRFSVKCPAQLRYADREARVTATVVDISSAGFQAQAAEPVQIGDRIQAKIQLGENEMTRVRAVVVREKANGYDGYYGFRVELDDPVWRKFVRALEGANTHAELEQASMFME